MGWRGRGGTALGILISIIITSTTVKIVVVDIIIVDALALPTKEAFTGSSPHGTIATFRRRRRGHDG